METRGSNGLWSQFLFLVLLLCSPSLALAKAGTIPQQKDRSEAWGETTAEVFTFDYLPKATEPCTADECNWWEQLRKAGNDILLGQKKRDQKFTRIAIERFGILLAEGREKGYKVPLKDRPPQRLVIKNPPYPDFARKNYVAGEVVLSVEYKLNGDIGDVKIDKKIGFGLDELAVEAARQFVFLPAVKDHTFVTELHHVINRFYNKFSKIPTRD
jgi:TonB family protein